MESAQECLQQAEQCERQAAEAQLDSNRDLAAASMWRKLAVSAPSVGEAQPADVPAPE